MLKSRYPSYVTALDWGIETLLNHFITTDSREARYAILNGSFHETLSDPCRRGRVQLAELPASTMRPCFSVQRASFSRLKRIPEIASNHILKL